VASCASPMVGSAISAASGKNLASLMYAYLLG